jgi:hypothetical protein
VHRESQKNKVENTPCAETVAAAAAMLALSNIGRGHDRQAMEARGEEENKGWRGRQQQRRTITISHQNGGGGDDWLLGNSADVSRLTGVGSARDEATRVVQQAHERGGG